MNVNQIICYLKFFINDIHFNYFKILIEIKTTITNDHRSGQRVQCEEIHYYKI